MQTPAALWPPGQEDGVSIEARAVSLGRALLSLERVRATGVMTVRGCDQRVRLAVARGKVVAASRHRHDVTLGDTLLRVGALDPDRHRQALEAGLPEAPVGDWLVRSGVVAPEAVAWGVRAQFKRRCIDLFSVAEASYAFAPGDVDIDVPPLAEGLSIAELVLAGLREVYAELSVERALRPVGTARLALTDLGERLLEDAILWPDEAAMVGLLRRGTALAVIRAAVRGACRPLRTLGALYALSAVADAGARSNTYSLLVRKRRQLRAAAGPHALLDLPPGARPLQARRALRRLAQQLHPDCFGPDAPDALRAASGEVMSALVQAECQLRSGVHRRVT